jgi:NADH-quinone oxidoreductase subunit K
MHPVIPYVVAAGLFGIGVYGVAVRRNAVLLLMAVELMLNAVNLVLVTADTTVTTVKADSTVTAGTTVRAALPDGGQVFALFVIVLAAAEIGVGLAVVLQLYRLRGGIAVDEVLLDPPSAVPGSAADGSATDGSATDSSATDGLATDSEGVSA